MTAISNTVSRIVATRIPQSYTLKTVKRQSSAVYDGHYIS